MKRSFGNTMMSLLSISSSGQRSGHRCYCLYYFTSHFHFVYIFFHCCALCTNICLCLLAHVFNPESKYSTSQLLTSDSRYSLLHICSIHQLLTSDSSCLLSCLSLTQPCSNVLHTFTHVPRNSWDSASD